MSCASTVGIGFMMDMEGTTIIVLGPMPPPNEKSQEKWTRERLDNEWVDRLTSLALGPIVPIGTNR